MDVETRAVEIAERFSKHGVKTDALFRALVGVMLIGYGHEKWRDFDKEPDPLPQLIKLLHQAYQLLSKDHGLWRLVQFVNDGDKVVQLHKSLDAFAEMQLPARSPGRPRNPDWIEAAVKELRTCWTGPFRPSFQRHHSGSALEPANSASRYVRECMDVAELNVTDSQLRTAMLTTRSNGRHRDAG